MKNTTVRTGFLLFIGALMFAVAMKAAGAQGATQALTDVQMMNVVGGLPEGCKALAYCLLNAIICVGATIGCVFGF